MKRLICCLVFALLVISSRAIGQEKKIQRSQLPPEVEQTVKTLSKTATIRGFSQEIGRGATYYEVELTVSNHRKDCLMDIKGNVVEVEKLCGPRLADNTPVVIIQQTAEKRELPLPIQDLDLHEICKLPSKCLHVLIEPSNIVLDMSAQQRLHAVVGELRS
jgi:hypothetical protein